MVSNCRRTFSSSRRSASTSAFRSWAQAGASPRPSATRAKMPIHARMRDSSLFEEKPVGRDHARPDGGMPPDGGRASSARGRLADGRGAGGGVTGGGDGEAKRLDHRRRRHHEQQIRGGGRVGQRRRIGERGEPLDDVLLIVEPERVALVDVRSWPPATSSATRPSASRTARPRRRRTTRTARWRELMARPYTPATLERANGGAEPAATSRRDTGSCTSRRSRPRARRGSSSRGWRERRGRSPSPPAGSRSRGPPAGPWGSRDSGAPAR